MMQFSTMGLTMLLAQSLFVAGAETGSLSTKSRPQEASKMKVRAFNAKVTPEVKVQRPRMHDRDEALRSTMRSMMQDDDADDDVWYGTKPKNGLIQTGDSTGGLSLEDEYMQESNKELSAALGPRWDSKVIEDNADKTTKAFLKGISSPKALGSLHAMMGTMAALR